MSTSGFILEKPIKPEFAKKVARPLIRRTISTSGFILEKPIKAEFAQKRRQISKKFAGGFFLRDFESSLQKDRSLFLALTWREKDFTVWRGVT